MSDEKALTTWKATLNMLIRLSSVLILKHPDQGGFNFSLSIELAIGR